MNTSIRTKFYTAVYCALGTAAFGALTTPALADEPALPSKVVKFADLNIASPSGAKVLYQRIEAAANEVCADDAAHTIQLMVDQRACIKKAIDNAVRSVNSVALSELRFGTQVRLASK
jgi:UrcA family protein